MLKKFPQNNEIKIGDVLYYNDKGGIYDFCPMILVKKLSDTCFRIRYYSIEAGSHHICDLNKDSFY